MKHYAKVSVNDLHGAVESLGVIIPPRTLAATGTDPSATLDATDATAYGSNQHTGQRVASNSKRFAKPLNWETGFGGSKSPPLRSGHV